MPDSITIGNESATLEWECELECRQWGVKDVYIYPRSLSLSWEECGYGEGDEERECEMELDLSNLPDGWHCHTDTRVRQDQDMICPSEVTVDFTKQEVSIEF